MVEIRYLLLRPATFRWLGTAACVALAISSLGRLANAQADAAGGYTWDTIDPAYAEQRNVNFQKNIKDQVMLGRTSLANSRVAVENWYRKYLFPAMASQEHLADLRDNRESILHSDLENVTMHGDQATHQFVVDLAFEEASRRVTGDYHPAVRFNAMLIIGSLNQTESRLVGTDRFPAVRLARAFDFMLDEYKKADQIDVVRIAAMLGIERHLRLVRQRPQDQPIPDARKAEITALMTGIVAEKAPADGRSQDGHTWMRRCGVDCLAALGQVGDGQAVFNTLVSVVEDPAEPLSLRCTAARAFQELSYADVTGIDAVATVQKLGALAAFACRNEDAWAKEQQKDLEAKSGTSRRNPAFPGMGGSGGSFPTMGGLDSFPGMGDGGLAGMGSGGYPGMGGSSSRTAPVSDEMEDLLENVRRRLKLPIYCVQLGVRGEPARSTIGSSGNAGPALGSVAQLATDEQQRAKIQEIVKALDELVVATDKVNDGLNELLAEVRSKTLKLETLLPKPAKTEDEASALPGADLPGGGGDASPAKKD